MATGASRILGLLRDMLLFALLGLSPWNGIFVFAFTIPNLFRRLLGEGALASAMLPLFSETLVRETTEQAFAFLNQVLTRLVVILTLLLIVAVGLFFAVRHSLAPHWEMALRFTTLLSPYLPLTCLCAMLCGALNGLGSFGWPALTSLWLNCSMLLAGGVGLFRCPNDAATATLLLCGGVLVGGFLQLAFPWILLRRRFWKFRWIWSSSPLLFRLWRLFLPALLGAAVVQINATISRLLAFFLTSNGISTLYLASRLVEVPLGVFSISIATVAFPELARLAATNDRSAFTERYRSARRSIVMVTVPALLGLCLLGRPILTLLFRWGNYGVSELDQTLPVLCASALGIPSYSLSAIVVRAFHAHQDMTTPLRIALVSVAANLLLTPLLAYCYDATGIALAGVFSSLLQWILLERKARNFLCPSVPSLSRKNFCKLLLANGFLIFLLLAIDLGIPTRISLRPAAFLQLSLSMPLGFICYFFTLHWLRFAEVSLFSTFFAYFFRRQSR